MKDVSIFILQTRVGVVRTDRFFPKPIWAAAKVTFFPLSRRHVISLYISSFPIPLSFMEFKSIVHFLLSPSSETDKEDSSQQRTHDR